MQSEIERLLQKTSRTFALTIPFLPEPTRREVQVAYLLFRIIDTFEDATLWPPRRRAEALRSFIDLLEQEPAAAEPLVARCAREPPCEFAPYLELLGKIPYVLGALAALRLPARGAIRRHLIRSAERMATIVLRSGADGHLSLMTIDDLRDYCYAVAGIVGEMLTQLYLLGRPELGPVAGELRAHAAEFGEGLQLVNILKDAHRDADDGRTYLPKDVPLEEVFTLAGRDLAAARDYVDCLWRARTDAGLVGFNASISKLATANLSLLRARGLGSKLSRLDVARVQAEVLRSLQDLEAESSTAHVSNE